MFQSFFASKSAKTFLAAWFGLAAMVAIIYFSVEVSGRMIAWNNSFGNIIQDGAKLPSDWPDLIREFILIAALFWVLENALNTVSNTYALYWREILTLHYIERWIDTQADIENAPQRITDCAAEFTSRTLDLAKQGIRAVLSLWKFFPMLWTLSAEFKISFLDIPGALFWITLAVSITSFLVSWFVTIRLDEQQDKNQTNEANLRSMVERVHEKKAVPKEDIRRTFKELRIGYLWTYLTSFLFYDLWMSAYRQLWVVLPILFFGTFVTNLQVKFGKMNGTLGVLAEVHGSLIFFANILKEAKRYKSVVGRLRYLETRLENKDKFQPDRWPHRDRRHNIGREDSENTEERENIL